MEGEGVRTPEKIWRQGLWGSVSVPRGKRSETNPFGKNSNRVWHSPTHKCSRLRSVIDGE